MNAFQLLPFAFFLSIVQLAAQSKTDSIPKYVKVPAGYLMVLRQGDNVFTELENLASREQIPSANFTGMGFVNATFGFFNFKTKEYDPRDFKDVELASMQGSVAWQNGKPSLHCHGVVTGKDFKAYGGHLLKATVSTGSVEIMVTVHDKQFQRLMEEPPGANVLNLKQ